MLEVTKLAIVKDIIQQDGFHAYMCVLIIHCMCPCACAYKNGGDKDKEEEENPDERIKVGRKVQEIVNRRIHRRRVF